MLGNGSDELISLLALACDVPGASILAPVPGFVMYAMSAQLQGLKFMWRGPDGGLRTGRGGHAGGH
jgi:histidinol-phosphate aminotransferase